MNVATVPPGGVAYAHVHVGFEVMLYILSGRVRHQFGEKLTQSVENGAGSLVYIEPGVPHEVFNLSDTEPVVAVVARSDADEWGAHSSLMTARRAPRETSCRPSSFSWTPGRNSGRPRTLDGLWTPRRDAGPCNSGLRTDSQLPSLSCKLPQP